MSNLSFSLYFFPITLLHLGTGGTGFVDSFSREVDSIYLFVYYLVVYVFSWVSDWDLMMLHVFKANKPKEKKIP